MKNKISPSMMCADVFELNEIVSTLKSNGADYLHIDVMDGQFVQNLMLGTEYCKMLKNHTDIPLDIHLMIERPEDKLNWFEFGDGDMVSVHAETTKHLQKVLSMIRNKGAKPIVALNPSTPICVIENVLDDIDAVLLMTVNPGFAGQKIIPSSYKKIKKLRDFLDNNGYNNIEIEVDGNVSFETAPIMRDNGANIFVAGSSSVFNKELGLDAGYKKLKDILK